MSLTNFSNNSLVDDNSALPSSPSDQIRRWRGIAWVMIAFGISAYVSHGHVSQEYADFHPVENIIGFLQGFKPTENDFLFHVIGFCACRLFLGFCIHDDEATEDKRPQHIVLTRD